jgi:hypothetical protein
MKVLRLAVIASFVFVQGVLCQPPSSIPKPGPQHQRLAYFVGTWAHEGEMKASPFGPGGKFTGTDRNEWFPGNFFVVMHSEMTGPMGLDKSLEIAGYNSEEKQYTFYSIDSMGMGDSAKGTVEGDTWTWNGESKMGGKLIKSRFIIKELSPASYSYKFDMSTDGGSTWSNVMEGKATKKST